MDSNNAVNSSQLSEQMNTAIPNEALTSISADPGRPTDMPRGRATSNAAISTVCQD